MSILSVDLQIHAVVNNKQKILSFLTLITPLRCLSYQPLVTPQEPVGPFREGWGFNSCIDLLTLHSSITRLQEWFRQLQHGLSSLPVGNLKWIPPCSWSILRLLGRLSPLFAGGYISARRKQKEIQGWWNFLETLQLTYKERKKIWQLYL